MHCLGDGTIFFCQIRSFFLLFFHSNDPAIMHNMVQQLFYPSAKKFNENYTKSIPEDSDHCLSSWWNSFCLFWSRKPGCNSLFWLSFHFRLIMMNLCIIHCYETAWKFLWISLKIFRSILGKVLTDASNQLLPNTTFILQTFFIPKCSLKKFCN